MIELPSCAEVTTGAAGFASDGDTMVVAAAASDAATVVTVAAGGAGAETASLVWDWVRTGGKPPFSPMKRPQPPRMAAPPFRPKGPFLQPPKRSSL